MVVESVVVSAAVVILLWQSEVVSLETQIDNLEGGVVGRWVESRLRQPPLRFRVLQTTTTNHNLAKEVEIEKKKEVQSRRQISIGSGSKA